MGGLCVFLLSFFGGGGGGVGGGEELLFVLYTDLWLSLQ